MDLAQNFIPKRIPTRREMLQASLMGIFGGILAACGGTSASPKSPAIPPTPTPKPDHEVLAYAFEALPQTTVSNLLRARMQELFSGPKTIQRGGLDVILHGSRIANNMGSNPEIYSGRGTVRTSSEIGNYPTYITQANDVVPITFRSALTDQERQDYSNELTPEGYIQAQFGFGRNQLMAEGYFPSIETTIPFVNDPIRFKNIANFLLIKEAFSILLMDLMIESSFKVAKEQGTNIFIQTDKGQKEGLIQAFDRFFENGFEEQVITDPPGSRLMAIADLGALALAVSELGKGKDSTFFRDSEMELIDKANSRVAGIDFGTSQDQIFESVGQWCLANYSPTDFWKIFPTDPGPFFVGNFQRFP